MKFLLRTAKRAIPRLLKQNLLVDVSGENFDLEVEYKCKMVDNEELPDVQALLEYRKQEDALWERVEYYNRRCRSQQVKWVSQYKQYIAGQRANVSADMYTCFERGDQRIKN